MKNPKFSFCKKEVIHLGIYGLISPCHLPSKKLLNFDKKSANVFDKKTQKSSLIAQGMSFYCNSIGQYETADRQTQNKTKLKKKRKRRNKFAKKKHCSVSVFEQIFLQRTVIKFRLTFLLLYKFFRNLGKVLKLNFFRYCKLCARLLSQVQIYLASNKKTL